MRALLGGLDKANLALAALTLVAAAGCESVAPETPAATAPADDGVSNLNLRLVGHNDLQARSAYQPIVHAYGQRRILFR